MRQNLALEIVSTIFFFSSNFCFRATAGAFRLYFILSELQLEPQSSGGQIGAGSKSEPIVHLWIRHPISLSFSSLLSLLLEEARRGGLNLSCETPCPLWRLTSKESTGNFKTALKWPQNIVVNRIFIPQEKIISILNSLLPNRGSLNSVLQKP